ncbi:MAG: hypothetical protein ACPGU6_02115 [Tenacibaculum sp.]
MKKWQKVGLMWAIWMFVIMTFIWPLIKGEEITLQSILIGIPIWIIGGLFFGFSMRKRLEEKE